MCVDNVRQLQAFAFDAVLKDWKHSTWRSAIC